MSNTNVINNETQLVSNEIVETLAENFNRFLQKSTYAVIEMGKIVVEARDTLSKDKFNEFCSKIRFDSDSKAITKLYRIGKKADLFMQYVNMLPSNWTTLYTLTLLSDELFTTLALEDKFNSALTGIEAQKMVNVATGKPSSSIQKPSSKAQSVTNSNQTVLAVDKYALAIQLSSTPTPSMVEDLQQVIKEFFAKIDVKVELSLSQLMQSLTSIPAQPSLESVA